MENKNKKYIRVAINKDLHYKFQYISKHEGRSKNEQMLYLIRKYIEEFKKEHGEIEIGD